MSELGLDQCVNKTHKALWTLLSTVLSYFSTSITGFSSSILKPLLAPKEYVIAHYNDPSHIWFL